MTREALNLVGADADGEDRDPQPPIVRVRRKRWLTRFGRRKSGGN